MGIQSWVVGHFKRGIKLCPLWKHDFFSWIQLLWTLSPLFRGKHHSQQAHKLFLEKKMATFCSDLLRAADA